MDRIRPILACVATAVGVAAAFACSGSDETTPGSDLASEDGSSPPAADGGGTGPVADDDSGSRTVPVGGPCAKDSDCASGSCGYTLKCVAERSCTSHNGGDTCGPDANESCCTTIAVPKPGATFKLDKYNITAGRFRVFIEKTKGSVRDYIQANRPTWFEPSWDPWIPNVMDDGTAVLVDSHLFDTGKGQDGVYQQLGPIHYGAAEVGGNRGCYTAEVGNARTYRLPDDVNTRLFNDTQQYPQEILDQKPQQCTTFFMFAAFCAWDGGRLPTIDELDYAWDGGEPNKHTYPWGNTPPPGGWDNAYPFDPTGQGFGKTQPAGSDPLRANYRYNFWMPKNMQCISDDPNKCDYSVFIAPPGRFPTGNGPYGHADLAGNVYDVAMPMSGNPGEDPAARTVGLNRTGAFDAHAIPTQHPVPGIRNWKSTNKYLAVGARCARD